jgi:hypothetical protein
MNVGFTPSTYAVNRGQDILVLTVPNGGYLLTKFTQRSWRWLKSPGSSPDHVSYIFYRINVLTPCWPLHRSNSDFVQILGHNSDTVRSCIIMLEDKIIPYKWSKWYPILFQDICYIYCPFGKNMQIGTSRRTYTTPNHNRATSVRLPSKNVALGRRITITRLSDDSKHSLLSFHLAWFSVNCRRACR